MRAGPYGLPIEWLLPAAYLLLVLLLFLRFRRDHGGALGLIYAFLGAWLGTLLPAVLMLVFDPYTPVLTIEVLLLAFTATAATITCFFLNPADLTEADR